MNKKKIYIGYWNNEANDYPEYPLPKENEVKDNKEALELLSKIKELGNQTRKGRERYCKGSSPCRCCKNTNGSSEYEISTKNVTYVITEGYEHYLKDHKVKPDENLKAIYEELKNKPKYKM